MERLPTRCVTALHATSGKRSAAPLLMGLLLWFGTFHVHAAPGDTELVSGAPTGGEAQLALHGPTDAVSAGGRYVVFEAGDVHSSPVASVVYLRDREANTTVVVSRDASGATRPGWGPSISANGRYVAFGSAAPLLPSDTNGTADVYVFDVQTQRNERVSVTSSETQGRCESEYSTGYADLTPDGRFVSFTSCANLTARAEDDDGLQHVYLRDRVNGTTELVFPVAIGSRHLQAGDRTTVSDDGRFVLWTNLLRDRQRNTWKVLQLESDAASRPGYSTGASLSGNGRYVVFTGYEDVEPGDTNGYPDVWLRDLRTGTVERMSVDSTGRQYASVSFDPSVSADGRYVAFFAHVHEVGAQGWQGPTPDGWEGTYVRDRQAGTIEYASVDSYGGPAYFVLNSSLSPDGMFLAFSTDAALEVPEAATTHDVYVHERGLIRTPQYDIGVFPATLDFGDHTLGTKPSLRTFIKNRGPSILILRNVSIVGTDRRSFVKSSGAIARLVLPGQTAPVRVTFRPSSLGHKSADLKVVMGSELVRRVHLTGTAVPP